MTDLRRIASLGVLACCVSPGAGQGMPEPPEGWRLVWHDEFEGPTLDTDKWRVEHAALVKNNELQFYATDEVYLEDGCLVLRSRAREMGGRAYTSGLVDSQRRFSQAFGRFEVRAKLPRGRGIWPAHWMLPEDRRSWPPEIDIMELLGHEPHKVHLTQHWGTWPQNEHAGAAVEGPDFSDDFHTFAVEWSPDRIDWFVDGDLGFTSTSHIPRVPFYVILNTAVGGDWPGNPDESTVFPQHHRVDYVRVYARESSEHPTLSLVHPHGLIRLDPAEYAPAAGALVTAIAVPDFGYRFAGWEGREERSARIGLAMLGPRMLHARFEPDPHLPPRLAGATAWATSSESPALGPANAVDGYPGTRWASEFSDPQELTIDLGGPASIELVRILWERAHARAFEVHASADGLVWETVHKLTKPDAGADVLDGPAAPVRYLRIRCTERATDWGVSIWEVEAYGRRTDE